jgi:hypothetical protein
LRRIHDVVSQPDGVEIVNAIQDVYLCGDVTVA